MSTDLAELNAFLSFTISIVRYTLQIIINLASLAENIRDYESFQGFSKYFKYASNHFLLPTLLQILSASSKVAELLFLRKWNIVRGTSRNEWKPSSLVLLRHVVDLSGGTG